MNHTLSLIAVLVVVIALFLWWRGSSGGARAESRLWKICQGDQAQAERLLQAELTRAPGISRNEAASRAVQRFERDNR
jgi:hypothetical protein